MVIQRFMRSEFSGVVFTADPISGNAAVKTGNYVRGKGEALVSGEKNAEEFSFDATKFAYKRNIGFERYAKALYNYCALIRDGYGKPMDIELAVSGGRYTFCRLVPLQRSDALTGTALR